MAIDTRELTLLIQAERRGLVGFLVMLTGNRDEADDLFQETHLEILRQRDNYRAGSNFGAWARAIARILVMRHWTDRKKSPFVPFSPEILDQLTGSWGEEARPEHPETRERALRSCVDELEPDQRRMLQLRYNEGWPHRRIAEETQRAESAVKMLLMRLRKKLQQCVESKLPKENA